MSKSRVRGIKAFWASGFVLCLALYRPQSTSGEEDQLRAALVAIAGKAKIETHAYRYLEELSDEIGGRVTGSSAGREALDWGVKKMQQIGLEDVHLERWNISRGWSRVSAEAELIAPVRRRITAVSMGWVGSTLDTGVEGEVVRVDVNHIEEEIGKNGSRWAGKILFVTSGSGSVPSALNALVAFRPLLNMAQGAHVLAIIRGRGYSAREGMNLTHTGVMSFDSYFDIPVITTTPEDEGLISRLLERRESVRLRVNVQNKVTPGPVETANVVGDIKGIERPEEIVLVGGHLDSWDLGSGTTDNGMGVVTALGAAEAIVRSGFRPRRTIRFVLFSGEEQGLLGSIAYTKRHLMELRNHVVALVMDDGQGPVVGLSLGGHFDLIPVFQEFVRSLSSFGALRVDDEPYFDTDTGPFILAGLPGISLAQESPEYTYTHHTEADTFDKVRPEIVATDAAVMGILSFWIAGRTERIAKPWASEQTAQMLVDKQQDRVVKAFGLWNLLTLYSNGTTSSPK